MIVGEARSNGIGSGSAVWAQRVVSRRQSFRAGSRQRPRRGAVFVRVRPCSHVFVSARARSSVFALRLARSRWRVRGSGETCSNKSALVAISRTVRRETRTITGHGSVQRRANDSAEKTFSTWIYKLSARTTATRIPGPMDRWTAKTWKFAGRPTELFFFPIEVRIMSLPTHTNFFLLTAINKSATPCESTIRVWRLKFFRKNSYSDDLEKIHVCREEKVKFFFCFEVMSSHGFSTMKRSNWGVCAHWGLSVFRFCVEFVDFGCGLFKAVVGIDGLSLIWFAAKVACAALGFCGCQEGGLGLD